MATHFLGCRLLGLSGCRCFPCLNGAGCGGVGIGELGKQKQKHICCLPLYRGNNPWGENAVEREEGEKIGGFLWFFALVYSFLNNWHTDDADATDDHRFLSFE